jgi:hypothetical protein
MTHSRGLAYHPAILESRGDEMSGVSMNNGSVVPSIILVSLIQGLLENGVRKGSWEGDDGCPVLTFLPRPHVPSGVDSLAPACPTELPVTPRVAL